MLMIMSFCLLGLGLFAIGYYFGNQIGRTQHIRQQLVEIEVRKSRNLG